MNADLENPENNNLEQKIDETILREQELRDRLLSEMRGEHEAMRAFTREEMERQAKFLSLPKEIRARMEGISLQKMQIYEQSLSHLGELERLRYQTTIEDKLSQRNNVHSDHIQSNCDTISVLFLTADPVDASRLRLSEEFREIHYSLRKARLRDQFKLNLPQLSVRPADISQALLDTQPQFVHFSGHGTSTGALCFESQTGQVQLVQPDALAALFEQFTSQVNCVLLNACYSEIQAKAIAEHIEYVIGMNKAIGDKAAIAFAIGFYQALGAGRAIEDAYKMGCVQIRLQSIPATKNLKSSH